MRCAVFDCDGTLVDGQAVPEPHLDNRRREPATVAIG